MQAGFSQYNPKLQCQSIRYLPLPVCFIFSYCFMLLIRVLSFQLEESLSAPCETGLMVRNCFIPERQLCQVKQSCLEIFFQQFDLIILHSPGLQFSSEKSTDSVMEIALCMNLCFSCFFFSLIIFSCLSFQTVLL